MNIAYLRYAVTVAEAGSFSKAAVACHVTQPTLSNGIASLEEELGGKLFDRTTRSVSLTPMGSHLLPYLERALSNLDEITSVASGWRDPTHRMIRIGMSPVVNMRLVLDLLSGFQEIHPGIEFFFKECYLGDLADRLNSGQLDVLILPESVTLDGTKHFLLYTEPLCYVFRDGDPRQGHNSTMSLEEASETTLILTVDACGLQGVTKKLFKHFNLPLNSYPGAATSYSVVEEWAALGIGAGILPASKIRSNATTFRPLTLTTSTPATLSCRLVWKPEFVSTTHLSALIKYIKKQVNILHGKGALVVNSSNLSY